LCLHAASISIFLHRRSVFLFCHVCQVAIGAAGGIDLLLRAMQWHPKNSQVQENTCWALNRLSIHASNKVSVVFKDFDLV
jgi:hypothetical protein